MKELDLLKKDWKKNENSFQQVSENDIYKMIHKNSSSVVRLIMIIGIIEFLFWIGISLFSNNDEYFQKLNMDNILLYMRILTYAHYAIIVTFIYLFYKNYIVISTTDSTKILMKNILKTRRTVNIYVWYNLGMIIFSLILGFMLAYFYNPDFALVKEKIEHDGIKAILFFIGIVIAIVGVFTVISWLFYKLLYGFLMKKLYKNYEELKKIDL
ncbi:ABC-type multidrug transport system fused ATPase/permease subunit [Flavobacterium gossypii]|uniref:ABC-type multidrug transport system fused ATPase/permease subunit n=1 Tax=Flavobacterium gossypii TaxID=1646119 RepID=A0ABR6DUE9_9FLAO|nr:MULTISPECIES: hypothetical protein [Flavobacterium]MBA9075298.1 ABC-type multidrug transport system fused ATPase/permease subunit [Flavobacterium gossypii]WDO14703.1 hypothetical protein MH928_08440 [Flavobacterium sp. WW92]